jgi:hypothetical protein
MDNRFYPSEERAGNLPVYLLALVGFFLIAWGVSTRINQPPNWWKSSGSTVFRRQWARLWLVFFTTGYLFLLTGIAIWLIATPPGTSFQDHSSEYLICWFSLLIGLAFQIMTIDSGFARDNEQLERVPNKLDYEIV